MKNSKIYVPIYKNTEQLFVDFIFIHLLHGQLFLFMHFRLQLKYIFENF